MWHFTKLGDGLTMGMDTTTGKIVQVVKLDKDNTIVDCLNDFDSDKKDKDNDEVIPLD